MSNSFTQPLIECRETALVGGKAANLGRLARAGFPVPGGFVVTTRACRLAQDQIPSPFAVPPEVAEEIRQGYRAMGSPAVAVRSSATAEDLAAASMAGQYETFLDVQGEAALVEAVGQCWAGLAAPRTLAYLRQHGIDPGGVAMAVVVQQLIPADVAGVLFTTNPNGVSPREMLLEASWGLGETVVSGQVQPDALRLDWDVGRVLAATIADKHVRATAGVRGPQAVAEDLRRRPCLTGREVDRLWQLGRRAAEHFRSPQDIEWAIHAGEIYVLQSRPITTLREAEAAEEILQVARQRLRDEAAAGRGPWVLHNLAETLPHPTPLAWSVVGRFMSGSGGFGTLYRQAGFEPSPAVARRGFLERIAGRVYMDASLAPEMFFQDFPFAYDLEELKRNPDAAQTPPTRPRGSAASRWKAGRRLAAASAKLRRLAIDFDRRLRDTVFPEVARYVADAKQTDLASLSPEQLAQRWEECEKRVFDVFAPDSLMPGLIAAMAIGELRAFVAEHFWDDDEDADSLVRRISSGRPAGSDRAPRRPVARGWQRRPPAGDVAGRAWASRAGRVRPGRPAVARAAGTRPPHGRPPRGRRESAAAPPSQRRGGPPGDRVAPPPAFRPRLPRVRPPHRAGVAIRRLPRRRQGLL